MEEDLRHTRVQSWESMYVSYASIKKWIGETYPFGYWTILGLSAASPQTPLTPGDRLTSATIAVRELESVTDTDTDALPEIGYNTYAAAASHANEVQFDVTLYNEGPLMQPAVVELRCRLEREMTCVVTQYFTVHRRDASGAMLSLLDGAAAVENCATIEFELERDDSAVPVPAAHNLPNSADLAATPAVDVLSVASGEMAHTDVALRNARKQADLVLRKASSFSPRSLLSFVQHRCTSNFQLATRLVAEAEKVEAFYYTKSNAWTRELLRLLNWASELHTQERIWQSKLRRQIGHTYDESHAKEFIASWEKQRKKDRAERERVKQALRRMYFAYTLLLQFVEQNSESLQHLVMKVEKRSQQALLVPFEQHLASRFKFFVSRRGRHPINTLLDFMENRYIELVNGDKKGAARALHVETSAAVSKHRVMDAAVVGVMFGVSFGCVLLSYIERDFFAGDVTVTTFGGTSQDLPVKILFLTGLVTLLAMLFSINIVVWDTCGVNYAFIFELDERRHWDGAKLMRHTMRYTTVWSVGLFVFTRVDTIPYLSEWGPLIPVILVAAILTMVAADTLRVEAKTKSLVGGLAEELKSRLMKKDSVSASAGPAGGLQKNPNLPVAAKKKKEKSIGGDPNATEKRLWFATTIGHILCAPLFPVNFSDFYIADQLTSLTGLFGQIQSIMCSIVGVTFSAPVLAVMPHVWRFLQCLRRWRDGPSLATAHPHISNAFKYVSGTVQILAAWNFDLAYNGLLSETGASHGDLAVDFSLISEPLRWWILAAVIEYLFKCFWDLYMDAGIFMTPTLSWRRSPTNPYPLLRSKIMYSEWTYWAFAVLNCVCRFSTLLRIILITQHSQWSKMAPVVWWTIEVVRRFAWNFFRVENEQVNNTEKYRAVDLLPPSSSMVENHITVDEMDEQFAALWAGSGKAKASHELPPKSYLFDRFPLHHKRSSLYALYRERSDVARANAMWKQSHDDALKLFRSLHNEDQVRTLHFVLGQETVDAFLRRYPANSKDFVDAKFTSLTFSSHSEQSALC